MCAKRGPTDSPLTLHPTKIPRPTGTADSPISVYSNEEEGGKLVLDFEDFQKLEASAQSVYFTDMQNELEKIQLEMQIIQRNCLYVDLALLHSSQNDLDEERLDQLRETISSLQQKWIMMGTKDHKQIGRKAVTHPRREWDIFALLFNREESRFEVCQSFYERTSAHRPVGEAISSQLLQYHLTTFAEEHLISQGDLGEKCCWKSGSHIMTKVTYASGIVRVTGWYSDDDDDDDDAFIYPDPSPKRYAGYNNYIYLIMYM
ncbi:hypothetical protein BJX65DRAFT_291091 [Aspergillus insuetus]